MRHNLLRREGAAVLLLSCVALASAQSVEFRGRELSFFGSEAPFRSANVTFVPVRALAERISADFDRSDAGGSLRVEYRGRTVMYRKGDNSMRLDGRSVSLGRGSVERNGILFVPVRFFEVLTNGDVRAVGSWNDDRDWDDRDWDDRGWGNGGRDDRGWGSPGNGRGNGGRGRPDFATTVTFRGRTLRFDRDELPFSNRSVVFVPLRSTADQTGTRLTRSSSGRFIALTFGNAEVQYQAGSTTFRLNGQVRTLRSPSVDRNGVLFVPSDLFRALLGNSFRASARGAGDDDNVYDRWDGR